MSPRFRALAAALLVAGTAGAVAMCQPYARGHVPRTAALPRERLPLPEARYAGATVSVRGRLAPIIREWVRVHGRGDRAMIVVLRGRDVAVCEDLGHQLRELLRATGGGIPAIIVVGPGANEEVAGFLRREHLHLPVQVQSPDSLLIDRGPLATPAVLVVHEGAVADGVAHPVRFANLRSISFAAELSPLLTRPAAPRASAVER